MLPFYACTCMKFEFVVVQCKSHDSVLDWIFWNKGGWEWFIRINDG